MEEEIIILNVMRFDTDGRKRCRVNFVYADFDKMQESKNFIGCSEIPNFYEADVFDKFKKSMLFKPVLGRFILQSNPRNPMRQSYVLKSIETDEDTIDLL